MEIENEDDLIIYEENKEVKETIWKVWDLLNDKEIIMKLLINSPLIKELEKTESSILLNLKEEKSSDKTNNSTSLTDKSNKNSKFLLIFIFLI